MEAPFVYSMTPIPLLIIAALQAPDTGAVLYHARWPDPVPSVFGYHEVFHVFVGAAAACQYVAIAIFVF